MMRLIIAALTGLLMLSACQSAATRNTGQEFQNNTTTKAADASKRATIRLQLATNYLEAGQPAVALEETNKAIELDSSLTDAYHVRALSYMAMNERALAEENFRTALSMRADDTDVLNNYGWFLCLNGRYGEALPMLQKAVSVPSASGPVKPLTSLGACQMRQGDTAAAEKTFLQALSYDRANPVTNTSLAQVYYREGDYQKARQVVGRVNNSKFASAQSLWLGARIARRQGDTAAQEAFVAQLRSRFPDSRELTAYEQGAWDE
jgi:type IV pilus assembly protein PilF